MALAWAELTEHGRQTCDWLRDFSEAERRDYRAKAIIAMEAIMPEPQAEKFRSPCPPPTAHQREVAELVVEECAEIIQRGTKLLRFGVDEVQPGQGNSNADRLSMEVGDLLEVIDLGIKAGILNPVAINLGRASKRSQLARFMQTEGPA